MCRVSRLYQSLCCYYRYSLHDNNNHVDYNNYIINHTCSNNGKGQYSNNNDTTSLMNLYANIKYQCPF